MHHRIHIDLEIFFTSKWHSGSGEGCFSIDRLVRLDSRNRPFIPGSTLKGIVRQNCEKISRILGYPDPSDPHQTNLSENHFAPFSKLVSPIDRIFGTKSEPGSLFFRDARQKDTEMPGTPVVQKRISRYRILKTSREKQLFSTEYSSSGQVLYTSIDGWHDSLVCIDESYPPFAYCLLLAGLLAVERIGGDKSTGAGKIDAPIRVNTFEYNQKNFSPNEVIDFDLMLYQQYLEMKEPI